MSKCKAKVPALCRTHGTITIPSYTDARHDIQQLPALIEATQQIAQLITSKNSPLPKKETGVFRSLMERVSAAEELQQVHQEHKAWEQTDEGFESLLKEISDTEALLHDYDGEGIAEWEREILTEHHKILTLRSQKAFEARMLRP